MQGEYQGGQGSPLGINLKLSPIPDGVGLPYKETAQRASIPSDLLCISGEKAMGFVTPQDQWAEPAFPGQLLHPVCVVFPL